MWKNWLQGDNNTLHQVGNCVKWLLTPAKELCQFMFSLDDAKRSYVDKYGCTMLSSADSVDVYQLLVYCKYNHYMFARYHFSKLRRVHSDKGWVDYQSDDRGVPGMIYQTGDGTVHSWLYVLVDEHKYYHAESNVMQDNHRIDYKRISQELFVR